MATVDTANGVVVSADRQYWWSPLARWSLGGAVVGLLIGAVVAVEAGPMVMAVTPLFGLVGCLPLGLVQALVWRAMPGNVTYEVRDGRLLVRRGGRVVREWPSEDVVKVEVAGGEGVTWVNVLTDKWLSYDSVLPPSWIEIRPKDRWDPAGGEHGIPAILLWGREAAELANTRLNSAVRQQLDP